LVSRFGDDGKYRVESAKMLATLLFTLQGTPYMYQGQEIGMTNVRFDNIKDYKDIFSLNLYKEEIKPDGSNQKQIMEAIHKKARDHARTPVQWNGKENAGFTTGKPWMKVNPNYKEINAESALEDRDSIFYYYKKLIELRKQNEIFVYGRYIPLLADDENLFCYLRELDNEKLLVILNFYGKDAVFKLPENIKIGKKELLISNYNITGDEDLKELHLEPYEARVYRIK
jgi:oligo-1,6-glucosidase